MIARNLIVILLGLALGLATIAEGQPQRPSATEIDGRIQWLAAQREEAANQAAALAGRLNEANAKLKSAQDEIERMKKLCGKACEPKEK